MQSNYLLELIYNGIAFELKVCNTFNLSLSREDDEFYYRKKINDTLKLSKEAFNFLWQFEQQNTCDWFYANLYCVKNNIKSIMYRGKFGVKDISWCPDNCSAELKLRTNDIYDCLLNNDKEVNFINVPNEQTFHATIDRGGRYEYYVDNYVTPGINNPPIGAGWALWFGLSDPAGVLTYRVDVYVREIIKLPCIAQNPPTPPASYTLINNTCSIDGFSEFAKTPNNLTNIPNYNSNIPTACTGEILWNTHNYINNCSGGSTPPVTICSGVWSLVGDGCLQGNNQYIYIKDLRQFELLFFGITTNVIDNTRGRTLKDTLEYLVSETCSAIKCVVSDFFQINPENPSNINYVTGEVSKVNNLILAEISDVKDPNSTEQATLELITFKEFYEDLKCMFDVRMFIDSNGCLRIEHVSYFLKNIVLDLTSDNYINYTKNKCCYSYDSKDLPRRSIFSSVDYYNIEWAETSITYNLEDGTNNPCVGDNEEKCNLNILHSDYEGIVTNADEFSNDGLVIFSTEFNGTDYDVINENGALTGVKYSNGHLSWANLLENYHLHNRPVGYGFINNTFRYFKSVKPIKKLEKQTIPFCCDNFNIFNEFSYIKNKYGNGEIEEIVLNLQSNTLEIDLKT